MKENRRLIHQAGPSTDFGANAGKEMFADALVRSWKQITKFKPASAVPSASSDATGQVGRGPGEGLSPMPNPSPQTTPAAAAEGAERPSAFNLDGMIRDERGIRYAPETED